MELRTLEIRIQNARANIVKVKNTLARHQKALDKYRKQLDERGIDYSNLAEARAQAARSNRDEDYWLLCDYDNKLDDIKNNEKKLNELYEKLESYKEQFEVESKRQEVPHIPALEEFLAGWKENARDWYCGQVSAFHAFNAERDRIRAEIKAKYAPREFYHRKEIAEEEKAAKVDHDSYKQQVKANYTADVLQMAQEGAPGQPRFDQKLEEDLDDEVRRKRLDLYLRCTAAVGVITDAAGLRVGDNGSINGFVVGENGKASVETVWAGGYNIQRLHYRVMVKPVRVKESLASKIQEAQQRPVSVEGKNAGSRKAEIEQSI